MGFPQTTEVLRTNRIHVVHKELHGVPSKEYLRRRPTTEGRHNDSCRTETPAMRRGKLAFYVIGEKVNSEVITIFLKNLV